MAVVVGDDARPAHAPDALAVERDIAGQPLIDRDHPAGVLDAGAVFGDGVGVKDIARAVSAPVCGVVEDRPVQRRGATRCQGTNAGSTRIPIRPGAPRYRVTVLAVGAEIAGIVRVGNLHRRVVRIRHCQADLIAGGDRARQRGADLPPIVEAPGPVVEGILRVEVSLRGLMLNHE